MSQPSKWQVAFRAFITLLVVAIVAAIIVSIVFTISYLRSPEHTDYLSAAAIAFVFAFAFTAAHTFILGLPLLLLGARLRAITWWSCILIGFVIGLLPSALVTAPDLVGALPMGALGAIGGLTFWLLWHYWVQRTEPSVATPQSAL